MANNTFDLYRDSVSKYLDGLGMNNLSAGYTPDQLAKNSDVQKSGGETIVYIVQQANESFSSISSLIGWIRENWQLAVLGVIAILMLLRR